MGLDRRSFLKGISAIAVCAASPLPKLPETYTVIFEPAGSIFSGEIGIYQGIILREVGNISGISPMMLGAK